MMIKVEAYVEPRRSRYQVGETKVQELAINTDYIISVGPGKTADWSKGSTVQDGGMFGMYHHPLEYIDCMDIVVDRVDGTTTHHVKGNFDLILARIAEAEDGEEETE